MTGVGARRARNPTTPAAITICLATAPKGVNSQPALRGQISTGPDKLRWRPPRLIISCKGNRRLWEASFSSSPSSISAARRTSSGWRLRFSPGLGHEVAPDPLTSRSSVRRPPPPHRPARAYAGSPLVPPAPSISVSTPSPSRRLAPAICRWKLQRGRPTAAEQSRRERLLDGVLSRHKVHSRYGGWCASGECVKVTDTWAV
jgi:hypothetical protein